MKIPGKNRDWIESGREYNPELWAQDLSSLLDEIEKNADCEEKVRELCRIRFDIAEKHGLNIEFLGPGEAGTA